MKEQDKEPSGTRMKFIKSYSAIAREVRVYCQALGIELPTHPSEVCEIYNAVEKASAQKYGQKPVLAHAKILKPKKIRRTHRTYLKPKDFYAFDVELF
jgi:hypothetical protein